MELNITKFFNETCAKDYQASVAEIGQDAGVITWSAAIDDSEDYMFVTEDNKEEIQSHFRAYGAWTQEEIGAWSNIELNAILIQDIAGAVREFEELADSDWLEYESLCNEGICSGELFSDGIDQVFFYVGD